MLNNIKRKIYVYYEKLGIKDLGFIFVGLIIMII